MIKPPLFIFLGLFAPLIIFSQTDTLQNPKQFTQMDIKDWLAQKNWIKPRAEKNNFLLIIPIIASNPSAGFIFGAGLTYAYQSPPKSIRLSSVTANASYSSKGLLNLNMKSNVFALSDKLILNGDWRFLINNETTYGLGTKKYSSTSDVDINGYETDGDSLGQILKYDQIRLYETGSWELFRNFFAGIGIHYDYYANIKDETVQDGDTANSYHYQYSISHGFNPQKYTATGLSLNFLFDSRDNQVNAYRGFYANANYRVNLLGLGSSKSSTMLLTEYRSFHSLDSRHRNVLAFWFYGNFVLTGEVPYLLLPALGYDQRQKTGRGYTFGRFRGEDMLYGETEYRFPISRYTGILGGVLFANATTTTNKMEDILLLEYLRFGYGGGLRIMLDKKSRTRLEIDAGIANKTVGFYLGAQETF
ncbi:MAG TPA: BamA/TamA family outer membrane protein [Puia sp.]|nr:BamA/TamA family outer membrane protein [Puia sp.]